MISPRLLPMMTEEGVFSVIATYLRLAGQGEKILAFRADEYYWRDLGKLDDLRQPSKTSHKAVTVALQDCVCRYTIMVHTGAMSPANKTIRQSVSLPVKVAAQVRTSPRIAG